MDMRQLQYFQVLAKTQHMTQASGILNLAQSALSRSLKNLEAELGVKLFDRIGKYIYLNENGHIFLKHVDVILGEYQDVCRKLDDRRGKEKKTVVLSMYAGSKLLPELICDFKNKHPEISLHIMQQGSVNENVLPSDITVYSCGQRKDELNSVVLMEEKICLAVPSDHPLARRKSIKLIEAASEAFICLHKGKGLRVITDELCHQAGFSPNVIMESDSPSTVRGLVSMGVGFTFVPKISWPGMGDDPRVSLVEIEEPSCYRFVVMKWRQDRYLTVAATRLREFLIEFFSDKETGGCK